MALEAAVEFRTDMRMNCEPLITVGLPTFNRANYIPIAVESVLSQSYKNIELIICDNASTDSTSDIVEGYASQDHRIRYYKNKTNIGACQNINKIISLANGEYFIGIGDDDIFSKNIVSRLYRLLVSNPFSEIAKSAFEVIDTNGAVIDHFNDFPESELSEEYIRKKVMYLKPWQPWPGILCRTALLRQVNGITEFITTGRFADIHLYFKIASKAKYVVGTRQYLWKYRVYNRERTIHVCPKEFCKSVPAYIASLQKLLEEAHYDKELLDFIINEHGRNMMRYIISFEFPYIRNKSFTEFIRYLNWYLVNRKKLHDCLTIRGMIRIIIGNQRLTSIFHKTRQRLSGI